MTKIELLCLLNFFVVLVVTTMASCHWPPSLSTPAISQPTSATQQIPTSSKEWYQRGIELKDKQQSAHQILIAFDTAVKLNPSYEEAYYELSKLFANDGDWDSTIANCSKAISLNANYLEAYYIRGLARMKKKLYDGAIADLNMAIGMEPSKKEMGDLLKVTNLIIPPGELILLHMQFTVGGGRDCRGNYMPYNNTLQLQLFVNPGDSRVGIDKIYLDPPIGGKVEINSPIRYFDNLGLQYLVSCISSEYPATLAPTCRIDYKSRSSLTYKKSNEISNAEIIVEPSELICPTN
ncbi:tetratricopeptide repeat protein [Chloroflexota bacterium]